MSTRKTTSKAAFRLSPGKDIGSAEWGDAALVEALGANNAFKYETGVPKGQSDTKPDNSIEGVAFQDIPNQVTITAPLDGWGGALNYAAMDKWNYWAFGYEDPRDALVGSPFPLFEFTVSGVSVTPTAGATYTNNGSTFTVISTSISGGAGTVRTGRTVGTNDPSASGTLTKAAGTGDATITFSAVDSDYYSKLFELDKYDRHIAAYRSHDCDTSTPDPADYLSTDRKNRNINLAVIRHPNDHRYAQLMCSGFGFSSAAGQEGSKWNAQGIARLEERGDYSSGSWTFASGTSGTENDILHHHWTVTVTPAGGSDVELAVKEFAITVGFTLDRIQSTESGLYLEEPKFTGRYEVKLSLTLARHSVDTYLAYRDSFQECYVKCVAVSGSYEYGLYMPKMIIDAASVDEEEVSGLPISFASGKEPSGGNPFTEAELLHTLRQDGPLFCIVKNKNSVNEMRRE